MAKFYGKIGFIKVEETSPGVHTEVPTERPYVGDLLRRNVRWQNGEQQNANLTIDNRFSVVGDAFAYANFQYMRYIEYQGTKWSISSFEIQSPRIIITVGGIYNG
mgnify:CR=1 FL=1